MGGQWVGPTQDVVLDLIDELGLETFRSYDDGEAVTVLTGGERVRYADETFGLPLETAMEVGRLQAEIERAGPDRRRSRRRGMLPMPRSSTVRRWMPG